VGREPRQTQGGWSSSMFEMTSLKPTSRYLIDLTPWSTSGHLYPHGRLDPVVMWS
jgi:hypothetical protein